MRTGNSPSYLIRNHYSYCFRMKVPKDLQTVISKKELRYSLGTGILSDAKNKARYLAGQFQLLFRNIGHMNLTEEQTYKLIREYRDKLFDEYDKPVPYGQYDGWLEPEQEAGIQYQILEHEREQFNHKRIAGDYSGIEETADELLIGLGLSPDEIDKASPQYSLLCRGLLRAELKGLDHWEKNLDGNYSDAMERVLTDTPSATPPQMGTAAPSPTPADTTSEPLNQGPLLSEIMEKLPKTKPNWKPATHKEYESAKKVILKILGDIPVGTITRGMMNNYRETLCKVPTFWTTRHKDIGAEGLPIPGADTISTSTIEKNLIFVGVLMDYIVDCEYLDHSPMPKSRLSLPDNKEGVQLLRDDQVKTILNATKGFDDHRYWLPILGLYTGCRINELCQLHQEDLKKRDGIWYLDINDEGNRTLKNKASKRLVPLHQTIIELGFIEFAQAVDHHRIFPGCKYREPTGKYSNNFGQWFNRMLVDTGIKEKGDRSITFHSFRHRAYTTLKRLGINNEHIDRITGHKLSETKNETYHHGYPLQDLKADVDQIPDHRTL